MKTCPVLYVHVYSKMPSPEMNVCCIASFINLTSVFVCFSLQLLLRALRQWSSQMYRLQVRTGGVEASHDPAVPRLSIPPRQKRGKSAESRGRICYVKLPRRSASRT